MPRPQGDQDPPVGRVSEDEGGPAVDCVRPHEAWCRQDCAATVPVWHSVEAIHGNKSQNARQRTLDRFRTGKVVVLVATDLAARGIDVDDITHVFNFDLPHEPETYVHRIGRTGRAGATGQAIAFCDPSERGLLKSIERLMRKTISVCNDLPVPSAPTDEERESLEKILAEEQAEREEAETFKPRRGPGGGGAGGRRRRPGGPAAAGDRAPREGGDRPRRPEGRSAGGRPMGG
ncbi:MAG: helicase-related protein, partial [Planctomycetaceae bacterium]